MTKAKKTPASPKKTVKPADPSALLAKKIAARLELFTPAFDSLSCEERPKAEKQAIDRAGDDIEQFIQLRRDELTFEEIWEGLTTLGLAPDLRYDDDGNFAASCSGFGPVGGGTVISGATGKHWQPTVRKALYYMLDVELGLRKKRSPARKLVKPVKRKKAVFRRG